MPFSGKIAFHVAARLTVRFWVPHLLRFATICHYSRLFTIIHTIRTIRYLVFGSIRCSLFATIRYSGFPDAPHDEGVHGLTVYRIMIAFFAIVTV